MRIVVDTNCLLVSIPKVSESRWLFNAILTGTIELAFTTDILQEYEEIIGSFYNSPTLAANVLETLMNRPNVIKISPYYFWTLITNDPDDRSDGPQQVRGLCDSVWIGLSHHRRWAL